MTPGWLQALPHADACTVSVCQSIPGCLLTSGQFVAARAILLDLAALAQPSFLPRRLDKAAQPDALATLWFAHAAYAYRNASKDSTTWQESFLPTIKRAVQALISEGCGAIRMDDGGMLSPAGEPGALPCPMGQNSLWYSTLAMLSEELHAAKDPAGDHFERLAGRFRRSFAKAFWCSVHGCLCDPEQQKNPDHMSTAVLLDPEQLLLAILPFSPIPRTKQRQLVLAVRDRAMTPLGVRVPASSRDCIIAFGALPDGLVSPLYLAWLVDGFVKTADIPQRALDEARAWLAGLPAGPLARFCTAEGEPVSVAGAALGDGPTNAEVARARAVLALPA